MFYRCILEKLNLWRGKENRKPLVLRGARQVGKTTAVELFSKKFEHFISLNLEISEDRQLFEKGLSLEELVQAIFFSRNIPLIKRNKTLLFMDEIQSSGEAIEMLRFFYEKMPELAVICAGSLLESLLDMDVSFPVGRVEYLFMHPCSFEEFLLATGEIEAAELIKSGKAPAYAHDKLVQLFHRFTLLGGMPEIIDSYQESQDILALSSVYQSLLIGYMDDVNKYATNNNQANILRHVIQTAPTEAGSRIRFQGFGQSNYGSRESGEAFRILEKAMLLRLVYPVANSGDIAPPFSPDLKKSPKLLFLDTGLVNYFSGIQKEFFALTDLNSLYRGRIAEHMVGQLLLAAQDSPLASLLFWAREKSQSTAEVDFTIPFEKYLIPVEVKSGKTGTMRSLHQFMDAVSHDFAIRLYAGPFQEEVAQTQNQKTFRLLHCPYYLTGALHKIIEQHFGQPPIHKSET